MASRANISFLLGHYEFFETIDHYQPVHTDYHDRVVAAVSAHDWQVQRSGPWFACGPPAGMQTLQGWKIHLSATPDSGAAILDLALPVLIRHQTPFKFTVDRGMLARMNSKNWSRGGAGKFVTLYPADVEQFRVVIAELTAVTANLRGPYILSDRRAPGSRVVHYRYGGFAPRRVTLLEGDHMPVIEAPDGSLIPDVRRPVWSPPSWAEDPLGAAEDAAGADDRTVGDGRFTIVRALSFSNTGGVYVAIDQSSGLECVIKEARPCVQGPNCSNDATTVLKKEYRLLQRMADTGWVPRPLSLFQDWEHWFLAQERVKGKSLSDVSARTNVTLMTRPGPQDFELYLARTSAMLRSLIDAVSELHSRGIVFGDLSPYNIIVDEPTGVLKLIDFEGASELAVDPPANIFTPGFAAPELNSTSGVATIQSDVFGIGAIAAALLFPINAMVELSRATRDRFVQELAGDVGLTREFEHLIAALTAVDPRERPTLAAARATLAVPDVSVWCPRPQSSPSTARLDTERLLQGTLDYIESHFSWDRTDRVVPADARVFATNPLSVACGAAGIARVWQRSRGHVPERLLAWMEDRAADTTDYAPGLMIGLSGVAWTLLECGHRDLATKLYAQIATHQLRNKCHGMFDGEAGIGLSMLKAFHSLDDEWYLDQARRSGRFLADTVTRDDAGAHWSYNGKIAHGFGHGGAGVAAFLLYLSALTNDHQALQLGMDALRFDLSSASPTRDGGVSWTYYHRTGTVLLPYLEYGSAGIAAVAARYHGHTGDDAYLQAVNAARIDIARKYSVQCGRNLGLAGIGECLVDLWHATGDDTFLPDIERVVRGVSLFALERPQGFAFPGWRLQRVSCDYGTGGAGVAHFLHRVLHGGPADLLLDECLPTMARAGFAPPVPATSEEYK